LRDLRVCAERGGVSQINRADVGVRADERVVAAGVVAESRFGTDESVAAASEID
jgi:hypothetical protein